MVSRGHLKAVRLPFRHEHECMLEDLVGLEPTVACADGLRIRSLSRWGHRSVMDQCKAFNPKADCVQNCR